MSKTHMEKKKEKRNTAHIFLRYQQHLLNIVVDVLPSAGLSPRAAEIMERVGLLWTERR